MMERPDLKIEMVGTDDLKFYEKNAKVHNNKQVALIANSIEEFGFDNPVLAWHNPDGEAEIVAGHGRVLAARRMGLEEVPVIFLDHLTDEQRRMLTHVDNKVAEAEWDFDMLEGEMEELASDFDITRFGFSLEDEAKESVAEVQAELDFNESLDAENNYIVLKFETDIDWIQAQSLFGIKQGKRYSTREDGFLTEGMTHIGIGRVIDGPSAINRLIGSDVIGGGISNG